MCCAVQVERLECQEEHQLLILLSHTAQRQEWQHLATNTAELEWWFDLPSAAQLHSWLSQLLQHTGMFADGVDGVAGGVTSSEAASGTAHPAAAAAAGGGGGGKADTESAAAAVGGAVAPGGVWHLWGWLPQQQANTALPADSDGAAAAAGAAEPGGSSPRLGYGWIRIRLLLPRWIPNDIEQRDYDLLCHDYIHSIPEQDGEQQQQQQEEDEQDEEAAGTESSSSSTAGSSSNSVGSGGGGGDGGSGASLGPGTADADAAEDRVEGRDDEGEIELDGGGVLVEVFEEAIDGLQELFDVLLESAA